MKHRRWLITTTDGEEYVTALPPKYGSPASVVELVEKPEDQTRAQCVTGAVAADREYRWTHQELDKVLDLGGGTLRQRVAALVQRHVSLRDAHQQLLRTRDELVRDAVAEKYHCPICDDHPIPGELSPRTRDSVR